MMVKMKFLLIFSQFIMACTLLSGCGGAGQSRAILEVSSFALVGSDLDIMLYARNSDQNLHFGIPITGGVKEITLPNGNYEFRVLSWDRGAVGTSPLTGTPHCGLAHQKLSGGDVTISINVSPANCFSDVFSREEYFTPIPEFKTVQFHSCSTVDNVSLSNQNCTANLGVINSVKVHLVPYALSQNFADVDYKNSALVSSCLPVRNTTHGSLPRLPAFGRAGMLMRVEGFTDTNCHRDFYSKDFLFKRGLEGVAGKVKILGVNTLTDLYLGDIVTSPFIASDIYPTHIYEDGSYSRQIPYSGGIPQNCQVLTGWDTALLNAPTCTISNGSVFLGIQGQLNKFSTGPLQIQYKLWDGVIGSSTASTIGTATFTLESVNDVPVINNNFPISNQSVSISTLPMVTGPIYVYSLVFPAVDVDDQPGVCERMYAQIDPIYSSKISGWAFFDDTDPNKCRVEFYLTGATGQAEVSIYLPDQPGGSHIVNDFFFLNISF